MAARQPHALGARGSAGRTGRAPPCRGRQLVATAAPVTPSSGNGPMPKMKHGPSTMLSTLPRISTRMATAASPAPRKTAFCRNSRSTVALPASISRVNPLPVATTLSVRAHDPQERRRKGGRQQRDRGGNHEAEHDRLPGGAGGALVVVLAGAARHQRGRADRQPHRRGVDHRHHRLGQADGRHRVGAEMRDPEHVGHREDRLHGHFHDHRHREHDHRLPDRSGRVVDASPAERCDQGRG